LFLNGASLAGRRQTQRAVGPGSRSAWYRSSQPLSSTYSGSPCPLLMCRRWQQSSRRLLGPRALPPPGLSPQLPPFPAVSVAGRTWVLSGFATRFTDRELEVFLPGRNQSLQLQRMLAASLKRWREASRLSRWPDRPTQTQEDLPARCSPWLQRVKREPSVSCPARSRRAGGVFTCVAYPDAYDYSPSRSGSPEDGPDLTENCLRHFQMRRVLRNERSRPPHRGPTG
jgi:hypothetical protein